MGSFDIEICSNCGPEISRSEQACVFAGNIVCAECDNTLRSVPVDELAAISAGPAPATEVELQTETPGPSAPLEQEKANQIRNESKPVGFIITGVILCLLGIGLIGIGLVSLAVLFLLGSPIFGILMAGWCLTSGILIVISGIVVTVIAVISRRR